ncbi:MAG: hypothetical protein NVSMB6_25550 [Burkholderiaceae bacterium]
MIVKRSQQAEHAGTGKAYAWPDLPHARRRLSRPQTRDTIRLRGKGNPDELLRRSDLLDVAK